MGSQGTTGTNDCESYAGKEVHRRLKRRFQVTVNGETYLVDVEEKAGAAAYLHPVETAQDKTKPSLPISVVSKEPKLTQSNYQVNAPIPGKVIEVSVKAGQRIAAGEAMVIIEAMKMENEITAPVHGLVHEVMVQTGETVTSGQLLVVIGS